MRNLKSLINIYPKELQNVVYQEIDSNKEIITLNDLLDKQQEIKAIIKTTKDRFGGYEILMNCFLDLVDRAFARI